MVRRTADVNRFWESLCEARAASKLTNSEIGRRAQVSRSQVGVILRGDFSTISENVARVGTALGLTMDSFIKLDQMNTAAWARIQATLLKVWDLTDEGAQNIITMLEAMDKLNLDRH